MSVVTCSTKLGFPKAPEWVAIRAEAIVSAMAISLQDVQNQVPTLHVSLSRVGVTNVEKVIRISAGGTLDAVLRPPGLLRRSRAAPEGRPHVPLRGGRQRRDRRGHPHRERVPGRDAGPAHRREGPRPPGRPAGRGAHRGALPGAEAGAGERDRHAGDLHAARGRRGERGGHPPAHRRDRPGHDRLPVRADVGAGRLARTAAGRRLLGRRDRARVRRGARSPPTTSAGSARSTSAAPRAARRTSTPSASSPSSRTRCRPRSTS